MDGLRSIHIFVCGGDDKSKPKISQYVNKLVVLSVTESGDRMEINGLFSMDCLDIELQHMSTTGSKIARENYMKLDCGGENSVPINVQHVPKNYMKLDCGGENGAPINAQVVPNKSMDCLRILKAASGRSGVVSPSGIMNEINMNCDSEFCVKWLNRFVNGNMKTYRGVIGYGFHRLVKSIFEWNKLILKSPIKWKILFLVSVLLFWFLLDNFLLLKFELREKMIF